MSNKKTRTKSSDMDSCPKQNGRATSGGHSAQIKPCHSFGVSKGVRNNLLFPGEETVIFPSGNHCVRYHIHQQGTQFIYGAKGCKGIQALALSPDRRYLAVSEKGKWGTLTVFDLKDEACCKRQVLRGSNYSVHEFVCMAFSADSKYLLGQAGGPTWTLFYWKWKQKELVASVKTTKTGRISQVSFNPQDDTQICVSGIGVFRIFELKGHDLKQADSYKMEKEDVLCHVWTSKDCIVAGTDTGKLLMLKSRQLHRLKSPYVRQTEKRDSSSVQQWPVTAITSYSKGFVCSAGPGLVCLYEKAKEKDNYRKTTEIRIPVASEGSQQLQTIVTMCISPADETLAVSTDRGQLYCISLTSSRIIESKNAQFRFLFHSLHSDSITGLSVCASNPLVATCSKDRTMHIWNYARKSLEQFKEFDQEPLCVSLHPSGLSILVGFANEVCLMKMSHDNFNTVQRFHISNCTECVFSHDGSKFAAVSKNLIHVWNVRTYETLDLSGHRKNVQSVKWSGDDHRLVSCGLDGTVRVWNILTGVLESKNTNEFSYKDVAFLPNTESILAVDRVHLHEIHDKMSVLETATDGTAYTCISMTHSGQTVFLGTTAGTVRVVEYPFAKERPLTEHHAHSGPVTKMVVTPCDRFLLTASRDGSLLIWAITDNGGRTLDLGDEIDFTEEVLSTKAYLEEPELTKEEDQKVCPELNEKHPEELEDQELNHVESATGGDEEHDESEEKMQDHEKTLYAAEDSQLCAMEDMKQTYEATLPEAESVKEVENSEEKQKMIKDSKLMDLCYYYECELQEAEEANLTVKAMENTSQYLAMNHEIDGLTVYKEEEVQNLRDQLMDAKENIKHLTMETEEQSKTICDQEYHIEELQETIKNLELSCKQKQEELTAVILESERTKEESKLKSDKERIEVERLEREVRENKETIKLIGAEMEEAENKYKKIIADQKTKLESQDEALITERQRVMDINILVRRMKGDIHNCAYFTKYPKKLRENFIELHNRYVHEADVPIGGDAEVMQEHAKHTEHPQNISDSEMRRLTRENELETERYMKEKHFQTEQVNEPNLRHEDLLTSLKEKNVQSVNSLASSSNLTGKPRIVFHLQHLINHRLKRNRLDRQEQSNAQQSSSDHVKLPPINTTTKAK